MTYTAKTLLAVFLGFLLVVSTYIAYRLTNATVSIAEMMHGVADTIGLSLLMISLYYKEGNRFVTVPSRLLLGCAGGVAMYFTATEALRFYIDELTPLKNPFWLIVISLVSMFIISLQLHLTRDVHHLLHGHGLNATYFKGNGVLNIKKIHHNTKTELVADLAQSFSGFLVGLFAFYGNNVTTSRWVDLTVSFCCGAYMFKRACNSST